jgi:hypothetical protein
MAKRTKQEAPRAPHLPKNKKAVSPKEHGFSKFKK